MLARLLHIPDVYDSTLAQDIIYTKVLNIFHSLPCILRGLIYDPVCIDYSGPNGRTTDELWTGEDLERSDCYLVDVLYRQLYAEIVENHEKHVRPFGIPTDVQTEHLQNTSDNK
jgi:hypothetical protein